MSTPAEAGPGPSSTPCSLQSRAVGEPLAGTAPTARGWVVLEHPGPWGRDAVVDSDLPADVTVTLGRAKSAGVTVLLARRPGRRGEPVGRHRVWVAHGSLGAARLHTGVLPSLDAVAQWDLDGIAGGRLPALDGAVSDPLVLVCTHGRRDACCAVNGRAFVTGLLEQADPAERDRVWECSHVGGHRFAAVVVTLPDGAVYGRMSADDGVELLDRIGSGRVLSRHLRGRAGLPPPLQVAEIAVRIDEQIDGAAELDTLALVDGRAVSVPPSWPGGPDPVVAEVRHVDGRSWCVEVTRDALAAQRAESCGGVAAPVELWRPGTVTPAPPWR